MKHFLRSVALLIASTIVYTCALKEKNERKFIEETSSLYHQDLKPFYHGVASGDPLQDRVILWTRVTPEDSTARIKVKWEVSESPDFKNIIASDTTSTSLHRDFTVKVDAR